MGGNSGLRGRGHRRWAATIRARDNTYPELRSSGTAWVGSVLCRGERGGDRAVNRAIRLSPQDPLNYRDLTDWPWRILREVSSSDAAEFASADAICILSLFIEHSASRGCSRATLATSTRPRRLHEMMRVEPDLQISVDARSGRGSTAKEALYEPECASPASPNDHSPPRSDPCRRRGRLLVHDGAGRGRHPKAPQGHPTGPYRTPRPRAPRTYRQDHRRWLPHRVWEPTGCRSVCPGGSGGGECEWGAWGFWRP